MRRKISLFASFLIVSMLFYTQVDAFHNGDKPANYNFDTFVIKLVGEKKRCIYMSPSTNNDVQKAGNYCVTKSYFEGKDHMIVYGGPYDVRQTNSAPSINIDNGTFRYIGLTATGIAVQSPDYRNDIAREADYFANSKFAKFPWEVSAHPKLIEKTEVSAHKSYFPSPRRGRVWSYTAEHAGAAVDDIGYSATGPVPSKGGLLHTNRYTQKTWLKADSSSYFGYSNNNIHDYFVIRAVPDLYTRGVFNTYTESSRCVMGYCYSTFPMEPYRNTNDQHDFSCTNTISMAPRPTISGKTVTEAKTTITLTGTNKKRTYTGRVYYRFEDTQIAHYQNVTLKPGGSVTLNLTYGINSSTGAKEYMAYPKTTGNVKFLYTVVSDYDVEETLFNKKGNNSCSITLNIESLDNASVTTTPSKTLYKAGEKIQGNVVVRNDFEKLAISAPPVNNQPTVQAKQNVDQTPSHVKDNGNKLTVRLKKGNSVLQTVTKDYKDIPGGGKTLKIPFEFDYEVIFPGTDYQVEACIPVYINGITNKTESKDDNCHIAKFELDASGDIALDLNGKEIYEANTNVKLRYSIDNLYPKTHTAMPVTMEVVNLDTNQIVGTYNWDAAKDAEGSQIKAGKNHHANTPNFKLPIGRYKVTAKIQHYPAETDYTNNTDVFEITVLPFAPENVECKVLDLEQVTVVEGDKGVSKFCIGQSPNFPSTSVESGQGTLFFVMYRILPMPIPAYEVTNLDDKGLYQLYKLNEPSTELGNENSFIYFPTDTNNKKNLKGPYTAGPHEFYHYLYRGRMLPTDVTFTVNVTDPTGKKIPEASGEIYYDIDDTKCFNTKQLDIGGNTANNKADIGALDPCRQVYFYLPKESTDRMVVGDLQNLPNVKDRLHFKNPGTHSFQIKAVENQVYRYQYDNGSEWQGNVREDGKATLRAPWKSESTANAKGEVNTHTVTNNQWIIQDTYNNHCYSDTDAFDRAGIWNGSNFNNNNSERNLCYHNHSKEFHKWKFNWSNPTTYGVMDKK